MDLTSKKAVITIPGNLKPNNVVPSNLPVINIEPIKKYPLPTTIQTIIKGR